MTEHFLHALDVCAAGDHHCGGGVPEIVHTGVRPADAGDNSFVVLVESMDSKMCSQLVRKNEVIRIVPQLTSPETIFRLAALFVTEIIKTERGWFNGARLPTLGCIGDVVNTARFLLALELLAYSDAALFKILSKLQISSSIFPHIC